MPNDTIFTKIKNLEDPASLKIRERVDRIADLQTNVLFYGETGVGKDFWAEYLLETSNFEKMVNLHCGDIPENLLESEWFGYKKGAFTGASDDYDGKWKRAEDGILFLNQIDLLSLNLQSSLLRIIERKKFFPLGSNQEVDINVRFLFSAEADIEQKVKRGDFRQDLFYRISSYHVYIPPLRERKMDIMPLLRFFARLYDLRITISERAKKILLNHPWRGNIREMDNFLNNISVLKSTLSDLEVADLIKHSSDFIDTQKRSEMTLAELEKEYIYYLLKKYKDKVKVAKILKISRKTLYNKLNKYEKN